MIRAARVRPALLLIVFGVCGAAAADEKPPRKAQSGRTIFAESARWIRGRAAAVKSVRRVRVDLQDVTVKGKGGGTHDGNSRIWLDLPDRFRWESYRTRTTPKERRGVKVLDGPRAWEYLPPSGPGAGRWERLHANPDNPGAVAQLQKDRDVFAGLTRYLTLQGLDGKGVRFTDEGSVSFEEGHHLAGRWLKVRRVDSQGGRMAFLFAFEQAPDGTRRVHEPRAVLIAADKAKGTPTEHIVLSGWRLLRGRRVPLRVMRYTRDDQGRLPWTLRARIADLAINPAMPQTLFAPPAKKGTARPAGR